MRKIFLLALIISFFILISSSVIVKASSQVNGYLFYGIGCSYCSQVEEYFEENNIFEKYNIEKKEIYNNRNNTQEFNDLCDQENIPLMERGVPMLFFEDKYLIGGRDIINFFKEKATLGIHEVQEIEKIQETQEQLKIKEPEIEKEISQRQVEVEIPEVQTEEEEKKFGLTLPAVIIAATVDAINPCAFAVLVILMTTILASGERKRSLHAGLLFALSIFISYYLMGLGLYSAVANAGLSNIFIKIIAVLALIIGLLNLKDYFWYGGGGFIMEVPMSWRPKLKSLIKSITSPVGAFFIGVLISIFLLPCTSGPYIVILGMLATNSTYTEALWLLLLYNFIFILPMVIITLVVHKGFSPEKAEEIRQKKLRLLHLIAGLLMIGLAILIFFDVLI